MTLIAELNWDLVRRLAFDDTHYLIDLWLVTEGADTLALPLLPERLHWMPFGRITMWRTLLLISLHEWSLSDAARQIGNGLTYRCFVRRTALDEMTPSMDQIRAYAKKFAKPIEDGLHHCAHLWAQVGLYKKAPEFKLLDTDPRYRAHRLMDAWSVRIKTGQPLPVRQQARAAKRRAHPPKQ